MTIAAILAVLVWLYLLFARGIFWQAGPVLPTAYPATTPSVAVVVPARDEAPLIEASLRSLLTQDYAGPFRVILTDDNSTDGTGDIARSIGDSRLTVITGAPRPAGWSGKLWAVSQGVAEAGEADLVLLTDADIVHEPAHLSSLVCKIERCDLDLVSEMVKLACDSWAERALVPAFVFFFQLLYPFEWVNDGLKSHRRGGWGIYPDQAPSLAADWRHRKRERRVDRRCRVGSSGEERRQDLARPCRLGTVGSAVSVDGRHLADGRTNRLRPASLFPSVAGPDDVRHGLDLAVAACSWRCSDEAPHSGADWPRG